MDGLTPVQDRCLRAIDEYTKRHGRAPTRRELAELVDQKSTNGINQILRALLKKGHVALGPRAKARNIQVVSVPPRQLRLAVEVGKPARLEESDE